MTTGLSRIGLTAPAKDREDHGPRPLQTVLYAILRYRNLVLATLLMGAFLGVGYGAIQPNSFESQGMLLLRSGVREMGTPEFAVSDRVNPFSRSFDIIGTEIQILSNREVFSRVVNTVGPARILEPYDPAAQDTAETPLPSRWLHELQSWWFASGDDVPESYGREHDAAVRVLMAGLYLDAIGGSMIRVRYETHDAHLAKEIVDAFLLAAQEQHRDVFTNRTSLEFLLSVEREATKAANELSGSFAEFKAEHELYDLDAERERILEELGKLENETAASVEKLKDQQHRRDFLAERLEKEEPVLELVSDTAPTANPEYTSLQQQIFSLRLQKQNLEATMDDLQLLRRRTELLDELIGTYEERLRELDPIIKTQGRQTIKNTRYDWLRSELDKVELEIVSLRATTDWRTEKLVSLRQRLKQLEAIKPEYDRFKVQIAQHKDEANRHLENRKNMQLLNLLDEHKLSNLQILDMGNLPTKKIGPNRKKMLLFGVFFGALLGACMALTLHKVDQSVHRKEDIEPFGMDILSVVPQMPRSVTRRLEQAGLPDVVEDDAVSHAIDKIWVNLVPNRTREAAVWYAFMGERTGVGATTLALFAAANMARSIGMKVLLVEADFTNPTLASRLDVADIPGFYDLVRGTASRGDVILKSEIPGLHLVHAGFGDPSVRGVAAGERLEEILRSLAEGYDIVLLDIPSIARHPGFRPLIGITDGVAPVFAAGISSRRDVEETRQVIESAGKGVLGAILNRWESIRPFWLPRSLSM